MSFIRIRTIKRKQYIYRETRYREGGKVRSKSEYVGPVRQQFAGTHGIDWDMIEKEQLARQEREDRERMEKMAELHEQFGMVLGPSTPTPVDAPTAAPEAEASSADKSDNGIGDKGHYES